MKGEYLRFYVEENRRHHGVLLWEWLLDRANAMGIRGGSAFRAIGGFGRHHDLHESRFFELAGSTGVEIQFIVAEEESEKLLALIRFEKMRLLYVRSPVVFGIVNPDVEDGAESIRCQ